MPQTIVLLEPDWSTHEMLMEVFQDVGYQVMHSATSQATLDLLTRQPSAALVTSVPLVDMALDRLCQQLQAQDGRPSIPLILLSTQHTPPVLPSGISAGFVAKPFLIDTLLTTLNQYLCRHPVSA